jgi:hypothetical protein
MSELPVSTIRGIVWGDNMDLDKAEDVDAMPDPMQDFIHRNQVAAALGKSSGTSVVLDMSVPSDDVDSDDNSEFWKAPRVVRYNPNAKTSDDKFIKLLGLLRNFFGKDHPEELAEGIEICERARSDARDEMIARA